MSTPTSALPDAPMGYYEFLRAQARDQALAERYLSAAIGSALGVTKPNLIEQAVLTQAAEHAIVAISHGGWSLMFDEDEKFKGIVT